MRWLEVTLRAHILEKLATVYVIHDEVDAKVALEDVMHGDDEGMVHL